MKRPTMASLILFARVMLRPLAAEPGRTMLTVFAVALGVSVVVAIELAGEAATGSFRSSMESLVGDVDFEVTAVGGVDETLLADLALLPYPLEVSPRIEEAAVILPERRTVNLLGLDLIGDTSIETVLWRESFNVGALTEGNAVWVGSAVGLARGETLRLGIHDQRHAFVVEGVLADDELSEQVRKDLVVMDIALAQRVVGRAGRLDRIEIRVPSQEIEGGWEALLRRSIPDGVALRTQGAGTRENQKMLSAFRWNLRVLSYISLVVGAFLIYYTISVSVVRRRTEIGILRALGTTRRGVLTAVLLEAGFFGLLGTLLGFALGRVLADGAVELMARTVEALYVSSTPGDILFTPWAVAVGLAAGIGVTLLAALGPAREAARIPPTEAMAAGRRHYEARLRLPREVAWACALAAASWAASRLPPVDGKPLAGYLAALLLIAAAALATPALVTVMVRAAAPAARRLLGVEGLLASRGLVGSLARTAVLVSTLATAVAMMASVAIMVGSFRETVALWLDNRLRADLYIRPAGLGGAGNHPTMDVSIADRIEQLEGVAAVDRFRAYAISYNGRPATLGGGETRVFSRSSRLRFLSGDPDEIMRRMPQGDFVVISEPFADKHSLAPGDRVALPLAGRSVSFEILGVYYDYADERGYVIADREVLLRYLPDPAPSSLAVYLDPGIQPESVRAEIDRITGERNLFVAENRQLREVSMRVFDRTFAITYALEAVAIFVAILGMAGALMALVIDRRREIAVLRFLGASTGQLRRLILIESGLLGLFANVLGLGLGFLLSLILIFVINKQSFGWTIQFHQPVGLLLAALSLIYVAAIVAGLYPARLAARLNPMEAVHEE